MTEFRVGDTCKKKESMWWGLGEYPALKRAPSLTVSKFKSGQYPSVSFQETGYYEWDAAYFELVEEGEMKNKFAAGDKVISVKDTPTAPEGFVGYVVDDNLNVLFKYSVRKEFTHDVVKSFREDELELLSVGGKEIELPVKPTIYDTPKAESALDKQIGGGHYKEKGIQPIEYIFANNLGFCEANIVKYATRWKDKNGIQDLEKIIHYTELLIELTKKEESKDKEGK